MSLTATQVAARPVGFGIPVQRLSWRSFVTGFLVAFSLSERWAQRACNIGITQNKHWMRHATIYRPGMLKPRLWRTSISVTMSCKPTSSPRFFGHTEIQSPHSFSTWTLGETASTIRSPSVADQQPQLPREHAWLAGTTILLSTCMHLFLSI